MSCAAAGEGHLRLKMDSSSWQTRGGGSWVPAAPRSNAVTIWANTKKSSHQNTRVSWLTTCSGKYLGPPKYAFFVVFGPKAPFGAIDTCFCLSAFFAYFAVSRNQNKDEHATLPDPKATFPDQKATFADHVLARF